VGQILYAKGKSVIKKSKEVIQTDARTIIHEARQKKEALRKKKPLAALNGIKDLKIDGSRLMDFLKDIKFKESPSQSKESQQFETVKPEPVRVESKPKVKRQEATSYYETWYNLIYSELKRTKKTI
jgi:succinate dehydrogenase/fumarate reductase-like Fe-S protein